MNNETLNRLNAFVADYKKESEEKDAIIKKQNQMLLRISAELEAIKQYDPFDLVLIAGSIENISNIIKGQTESTIDEECIGCAGPCKVVDVAAKLQEELDAKIEIIKNFKTIETQETDRLHEIILNMDVTISDLMDKLKDRNIEDLKELYDLDKAEIDRLKYIISARDLSIKSLTIMCQSSGSIRKDLTSTICEKDKMLEKYRREIVGLRDMHDVVWDKVHALEAELSARKEDSAVLKKVVEIVKNWEDDMHWDRTVMKQIATIIKDYLDAPEGPPETPIDDLYKVTVTCAFLEMP